MLVPLRPQPRIKRSRGIRHNIRRSQQAALRSRPLMASDELRGYGRNVAERRKPGMVYMKIAVITPHYREDVSILHDCHRSVRAQSVPCTHVMVADGSPSAEVQSWDVDHIILPRRHQDYGSTPRLIGSFHAAGLGFDGVAFLDADNWYRFDDLERLLYLHRHTGAPLLSSARIL